MSLSIVIPTTAARFSIFKTIDSVYNSILELDVKIEVVVNRLKSNRYILERLERDSRIELRFQSQIHQTAEASAIWAAYTSTSDWIWLLGDDDVATLGSINHVIDLLEYKDVDFWLLNVLLAFNHIPLEYYRIGPKPIQVCSAYKLWERCGFFSILTTISCFLLKRSVIDIMLFEEFHKIQGVYSHSFSLLAMLKNSQVGATDYFCVTRNEGTVEEIEESLTSYTKFKNLELSFLWTSGARELFEVLSKKTGIPVSEHMNYREIELRKSSIKSYLKISDLEILVSRSRSVMDRSNFEYIRDLEISEIEELIFPAPVRISL
jgi:hypothetical protein